MNLRDILTRAAEAGGAWDVDHVADLIERRTRLRVELTADIMRRALIPIERMLEVQ